jgi:drug/metabolite transporter (DMT)-like permease
MIVKKLNQLNSEITSLEIIVTRSLVQLILFETKIRLTKGAPTYMDFSRNDLRSIMVWIVIGFPAWLLLYVSLEVLPVGLAETLQNLTPFMTLCVGYLVLNETLKMLEIANMLMSFSGVLFIVTLSSNHHTENTNISTLAYLMGIFMCALSALIFSGNNVIIRSLKHLDTLALSTIYSALSLVVSVALWVGYRTLIKPNSFDIKSITGT